MLNKHMGNWVYSPKQKPKLNDLDDYLAGAMFTLYIGLIFTAMWLLS